MGTGLLKKAIGSFSHQKQAEFVSPEKTVSKIRGRIEKLTRKETGPYAALCMMKAQCGFQAGACLFREGETYSSSVTVGFGLGRIVLDAEKIFSPSEAQKDFFNLSENAASIGINSPDASLSLWVFPLDSNSPWETLMLFGASKDAAFDPEGASGILDGIKDIFRAGRVVESNAEKHGAGEQLVTEQDTADFSGREEAEGEQPEEENSVMEREAAPGEETPESGDGSTDETTIGKYAVLDAALTDFNELNPAFGVILLVCPPDVSEEQKGALRDKLEKMVSGFGKVIPVPTDNAEKTAAEKSVVLIPKNMDTELVAHRLKASLNMDTPLNFEAENSGEALEKLKLLL